MNKSLIALAVAGATFALTACNAPDRDRTVSIPRTVSAASTVQDPPSGYSAPRAQRDLSPPAADANKAAPGTDPEAAFANRPNFKDPTPQKEKGDSAEEQHQAVIAQDAASKAPDTASADEAKKAAMSEGSSQSGQGGESGPRHGTLTKGEETNRLPKEGQVNNYSSTDLEKNSGRPSN